MSAALRWLRVLGRAVLAAAIVALLSWTLVECAPGTTAERAAYASRALTPLDTQTPSAVRESVIASVGERHDLDRSFPLRQAGNLGRLLLLDFGKSWQDEVSVTSKILAKPGLRTLSLSLIALLVSLAVGLWGATASARRAGRVTDTLWSVYAALLLCLPLPWLALLALRSFAYGHPFSWLPPGGLDSFGQMVLPVLLLASAPTAVVWRHAREELSAQYESPWVLAARARGTQPNRLWRVYILRVALPTVLALVPPLLAYLFAASVVVERVFAIEGVGDLIARAAAAGDAPVLIAAASLSAALISLMSSGSDALARRLDPRRASSS